jgi:hypothetical protein
MRLPRIVTAPPGTPRAPSTRMRPRWRGVRMKDRIRPSSRTSGTNASRRSVTLPCVSSR